MENKILYIALFIQQQLCISAVAVVYADFTGNTFLVEQLLISALFGIVGSLVYCVVNKQTAKELLKNIIVGGFSGCLIFLFFENETIRKVYAYAGISGTIAFPVFAYLYANSQSILDRIQMKFLGPKSKSSDKKEETDKTPE